MAAFPEVPEFNMGYGLFWFAGSAFIGPLYGTSVIAVVIFSVAAQLVAVPIYAFIGSLSRRDMPVAP